jgi:hypothetical protein
MSGLLARLGDTTQRVDQVQLDRWARVACMLALLAYAVHAAYAVATHRALYGDAAWFLVKMITERDVTSFYSDFSREFYYSRFVAYAMTQLPALTALHSGVDDPRHLSWVLGATYFIHKPLSLWLCYRLLPTGNKSYVLFPLLGLFAGSINSEIYIVTETHLATSFLWPLLVAITQLRQPGNAASAAIAGGLLLSSFVYESFAFFGPVLLLACVVRGVLASRQHRGRWVLLSACAMAPIAMSWAAILFPRDPTNKSAFTNGVVKVVQDTLSGMASAHVVALASVLSLVSIAALIAWVLLRRPNEPTVVWWTWGAALVLALLPGLHFLLQAASPDFTYSITDRGFGGLVMQVGVIGLYLLVLVLPTRVFRAAAPSAFVIASGLVIGQVAWQLLATHAWQGAISQFERVITTNDGLENCTSSALPGARPSAADSARILCHWWVLPLSVVLAPDSGVHALVMSPESFVPFDPRAPQALPNTPDGEIEYQPYLRALTAEKAATVRGKVDVTSAGGGGAYFRAGFSHPEAWATWTDGKAAKLELCFERGQADPLLTFKVAPQLTAVRPRLGAVVSVNGARAGAWDFHLGETVVERQVAIPRNELDANGCGMLDFTFDDDRQASEIGVPGDPRRLGLAFVSMQIRY